MDRYGISLGKKTQPHRRIATPIKISESAQVTKAAKGMNFSITGPNGFRCMFPVSNLTLNRTGAVFSITGNDIQIILTGHVAHQMCEDFQGHEEEQRLTQRPESWYTRPHNRYGRTVVS